LNEQLLQSIEVLTNFKIVFYIKERHVIFSVRVHSVQTLWNFFKEKNAYNTLRALDTSFLLNNS